ncbi:MAG: Crp/Fnr family transcriptional regulator [Hyphomicrobium sp.]
MTTIENALDRTAGDEGLHDGADGGTATIVDGASALPAAASGRRQRGPLTGPTSTAIYAKRHTVFEDHHPADAIYQVISGAVILTRPVNGGRRQVIEVVGPGGLLGVVSGTHYGCRAETMTRTILRRITRRTIERSTALQRVIGQALTRKLERLHEETSMRTRMSATECVAALILSLPRAEVEAPPADAACGDYRLALPQSDMASYLGLAIETVCRAMKNLKRMGAIRTSGREWIAILDEKALARLAASEPASAASN